MVKLVMPRKKDEHEFLRLAVRLSEWAKVLSVNGTVLLNLLGQSQVKACRDDF